MCALNATLFVPLGRSGELHVDRQTSAESGKFCIDVAREAAQHFDNGRRGIIEHAVTCCAAELNARAQQSIEECGLVFGSIAAPEPCCRIA